MSHPRARFRCWGTRGTFPSPGPHTLRYGGNTACVEVQVADGAPLILDAGTGLRPLGQSLSTTLPAGGIRPAVTLLLTHRHGDHVIGLAHFAPIITRSHEVRIACAGVGAAALRLLVDQQLSAPLFPTLHGVTDAISVESFDANDQFAAGATCRVRAFHAHHPGGAAVLRVDDERGPLIAYAPDNELAFADQDPSVSAWRNGLADALRGVPVLLHDATYIDDELALHRGWGHSSVEEATRFAMQCGAGRLLLMHHHPDRTDDQIDVIVARCQAMAAGAGSGLQVAAATEGMSVEVA